MNAPPWMDGAWTKHFFSLGSYSPTNIPILEGFENVPSVLKLRFIQLNGLKTRKQG
jgi:hypothetical protein